MTPVCGWLSPVNYSASNVVIASPVRFGSVPYCDEEAPGTTVESHPAAAADRYALRSFPTCQRNESEDNVDTSTFTSLLTTDGTFYQTESVYLADRAAGMGVPSSEIEDVVAEVWLELVKYWHKFADGDAQWRLHGWMLRVLRSKAADARRRLRRHPCESLGAGEEELIDHAEGKRAEAAEWEEWLTVRLEIVGVGKEESLRLLCAHFYHERSIQELAQQFGMTPDAIDCRVRRLLKMLRNLPV